MDHVRLRGKEIYVGEAKYRRDSYKRKKAIDVEDPRRNTGAGEVDRGKANDHLEEKRRAGEEVGDRGKCPAQTRDHWEGRIPIENAKDNHGNSRTKEVGVIVA
ncbi:hypothetical protein S245_019529 [Arachis hypogaea]